VARKIERNGWSAVYSCYWATEGKKKIRHKRGTWRRRGGGRAALGLAWSARERPAGEDSRAVLGRGTTRGGDGSRRWRRGGAGTAVSGADTSGRGAAGEAGGAEEVPEEEEEGRRSEGLHWKLQKP
jgi:hypothetical protein